uniref:Aryl hydrocarbon receptor n=1 Tax=Denticeps clupeoides TaxID=299321 RepID=A0AAY4DJH0_9TELE
SVSKIRKRKVKQPPVDGVKSNPSKRHRDRLNSELDRLASLLPFPDEVTSNLDKLSILRLSVSYLRAKNFFSVALKNQTSNGSSHDNSKATRLVDGGIPEGELLLQALHGFVLVVTAEGIIFYSSHTIQDYLGFHQTDVMHQSVFELIHTEDQQEFRKNLHWAFNPPSVVQPDESPPDGEPVSSTSVVTYNPEQLPPENSSFLERSFVCRFRCLLDNSSGFLALNLQGRLKFLHGQNQRLEDGCQVPPQLALFAIATPLQPPPILEIRTKNMIFRTKHKLDFTPMACDAKGKIVLGYTEAELRVRGTGYQFIHAADMLYCAENHVRMIKTGESGLTVFRLLTKDNRWKWVQANARLVYKNGKPDYIIATQRPLVDEEGGEHLRKRSIHLPFTFATGEALLYQTSYPVPGFLDPTQGKGKSSKSKKNKSDKSSKDSVDPNSLLGAMMRQDESVYVCQPAMEPKISFHSSFFSEHGESSSFNTSLANEGWNAAPNGVTSSKVEPSSFDPLLATLDSLSLDTDENCPTSELFSALENLGLNAEDLELLLLDERMVRVDMEPDYIPSLNDLLTNNEILNYIQDSLENRTGEAVSNFSGDCPQVEISTNDPNRLTAENTTQSRALTPTTYSHPSPTPQVAPMPYLPYQLQKQAVAPIVHLSQQMQQHVNNQASQVQTWSHVSQEAQTTLIPMSQQGSLHMDSSTAFHNGHWPSQHEPLSLDNQCPFQQEAFSCKAPEAGLHETPQQQPWHQDQLLVQLHSQCHFKQRTDNSSSSLNGIYTEAQWKGYSYTDQVDVTPNRPRFTNGHPSHTQTAEMPHMAYSMVEGPGLEYPVNSSSMEGVKQCQGVLATASSYQVSIQKEQAQQTKPPTSCYPPYQTQNNPLECILGLSQSQHLNRVEAYGMVSQDTTHSSKMENGCILNSSSVAYTGGCLVPNSNTVTTSNSSRPEPLSSVPDPQATGFYL